MMILVCNLETQSGFLVLDYLLFESRFPCVYFGNYLGGNRVKISILFYIIFKLWLNTSILSKLQNFSRVFSQNVGTLD